MADDEELDADLYVFGEFRLDVLARRLTQGEHTIALTEKRFELLLYFVRHAEVALTRRQILDELWPDTVVEDGNLSVQVRHLRQALGDTDSPHRYLETIPKRGYRFVGKPTRAVRVRAAQAVSQPAFPLPLTPFVGREREIHELLGLLGESTARLVTLLAPGGMGKSRLALEVGRKLCAPRAGSEPARFADGVSFVSLAGLEASEFIASTIVRTLGAALRPATDPKQCLLEFLRDQRRLLVLDNFEHLLGGACLVGEILEGAPSVKVLATSRESLGLKGETLYHLSGLGYATTAVERSPHDGALPDASGRELFHQVATRRVRSFAPSADECSAIDEICSLLQGMPLGIELAAGWVGPLSPCEIARELEQGLDFLTSQLRDLPERQRSMRAVFEHSWNLLTDAEKGWLARLSCFRGGFTRQAAEAVAHATLNELSALMHKSLVTKNPASGRYEVHEVLRQFALAKLRASGLDHEETLDRHSSYFAAFLAQREAVLKSASPRDALERIDDELDNVRVAWARMIERSELANISASLSSLNLYYARRGPLDESEAAFARAAERLGSEGAPLDPFRNATLAELLTVRAGHLRQQGRYLEAVELLNQVLASVPGAGYARTRAYALVEQGTALLWAGDPARGIATTELGVALFRGLDDAWGLAHSLDRLGSVCGGYCGGAGDFRRAELAYREGLDLQRASGAIVLPSTLAGLGFVLSRQGDYSQGCRLMQEGLERIEAAGDTWNAMAVRLSLANAQRNIGRYTEAEQNATLSLELARRVNSWEFETWAHYQLGDIFKERGAYGAAFAEYQAGHVRAAAANDTGRIAVAKLNFGDLALLRGELAEARSLFDESLSCFESVRETWGIALARDALGYLACRTGQHAVARAHLREALVAAASARLFPYVANTLAGVALLHLEMGQIERGLELLGLVQHHPATERHTLARRVQPTLDRFADVCSQPQLETGLAQGRTLELERVIEAVIHGELG